MLIETIRYVLMRIQIHIDKVNRISDSAGNYCQIEPKQT